MSNKIKIDPKNYRLHNDKSKELVKKSLKELGAGRSIIIDAEGNIIGGNCTFEQAKKLNIPVEIIKSDGSKLYAIQRTDLKTNDEKRKKLAILDNSTTDNSDFDFKTLQEDFSLEELTDLGVEVEGIDVEEEDNGELANGKKLLKCPACGHINEEKAFKTYLGEDEDTD
jgi:hypothetical protein